MALTIDETNALIKNQEDNYEEIRRIWENIKQDSTARKTQKYVDERKSNFDSIYQRAFDRRLQEQEVLSSHKYLTLNHFDVHIKRHFDEAMLHLTKRRQEIVNIKTASGSKSLTELKTSTTCYPNATQDFSISSKLFIQKYGLNQFRQRLLTAQTAITENKPTWHLQSLTKTLEKLFQGIDETHIIMQLLLCYEQCTISDEYFMKDLFTDVQDAYETVIELLQEKVLDKDKQTIKTSSTKLPGITILFFTGNYDTWTSCYDLFNKIIDEDCTISTKEKMQYLKTHVRGDAEKLIEHLTVNEVQYKAALTLLRNRYKDERLLTQTYFIDKLLELTKYRQANGRMLRDMHLEDPILSHRKWDSATTTTTTTTTRVRRAKQDRKIQ